MVAPIISVLTIWRSAHALLQDQDRHAAGARAGRPPRLPPVVGLVYADDEAGRLPAAIMKDACDRLIDLAAKSSHFGERPRIIAAGFAMDNIKALAFAEAEMPLHLVGPNLEDLITDFARRLVNSAKVIE